MATDRDELPENITLKDDTVGIATWALFLKEKSTLNIPASVKYVSEEPYPYTSSNTVKIYGNKAESRLLTNVAIKDVYFYDPECDLSDCTINEYYSAGFVSSSDPEKTEYTVIHGYKGSTAEAYAKEHNRPFEEIKDENTILYGDANCNGTVDLSDAVLIMQCISNPDVYGMNGTGPVHMTKEGRTNGDVFGHDGLTVKDALTIQQYMLDLIHSLPAD